MTIDSSGTDIDRRLSADNLVAAFDKLSLSPAKRLETLRLDQIEGIAQRRSLAETTVNAGIQYALLYDRDTFLRVFNNPNLNSQVVAMMVGDITNIGTTITLTRNRQTSHLYYLTLKLLNHKIVVADVVLFKQAWNTFMAFKDAEYGLLDPFAASDVVVVEDTLELNSAREQDNNMSVSTLLFLLGYLKKCEDTYTSGSLLRLRDRIVENRKVEIESWVKKNMPDYADLPFSWAHQVIDLYGSVLSYNSSNRN